MRLHRVQCRQCNPSNQKTCKLDPDMAAMQRFMASSYGVAIAGFWQDQKFGTAGAPCRSDRGADVIEIG
jgi:hypothetical protein